MNNPQSAGNQAKYQSWTLAHERIRAALDAGFPLEAVTLIESLLADRFLSFANHHGAGLFPASTTLGQVARVVLESGRLDVVGIALAERGRDWMRERNEVLHSIGKSLQGEAPPIAADHFVEHAHGIALQGLDLLREVKAWHAALLRSARR